MKLRNLLIPLLMITATSIASPRAQAQTTGDGSGGRHGHQRNSAQWQACRHQADDKKLERGEARQSFIKECLKAAGKNAGQPGAGN